MSKKKKVNASGEDEDSKNRIKGVKKAPPPPSSPPIERRVTPTKVVKNKTKIKSPNVKGGQTKGDPLPPTKKTKTISSPKGIDQSKQKGNKNGKKSTTNTTTANKSDNKKEDKSKLKKSFKSPSSGSSKKESSKVSGSAPSTSQANLSPARASTSQVHDQSEQSIAKRPKGRPRLNSSADDDANHDPAKSTKKGASAKVAKVIKPKVEQARQVETTKSKMSSTKRTNADQVKQTKKVKSQPNKVQSPSKPTTPKNKPEAAKKAAAVKSSAKSVPVKKDDKVSKSPAKPKQVKSNSRIKPKPQRKPVKKRIKKRTLSNRVASLNAQAMNRLLVEIDRPSTSTPGKAGDSTDENSSSSSQSLVVSKNKLPASSKSNKSVTKNNRKTSSPPSKTASKNKVVKKKMTKKELRKQRLKRLDLGDNQVFDTRRNKRMASLNASAMMAATFLPEERNDRCLVPVIEQPLAQPSYFESTIMETIDHVVRQYSTSTMEHIEISPSSSSSSNSTKTTTVKTTVKHVKMHNADSTVVQTISTQYQHENIVPTSPASKSNRRSKSKKSSSSQMAASSASAFTLCTSPSTDLAVMQSNTMPFSPNTQSSFAFEQNSQFVNNNNTGTSTQTLSKKSSRNKKNDSQGNSTSIIRRKFQVETIETRMQNSPVVSSSSAPSASNNVIMAQNNPFSHFNGLNPITVPGSLMPNNQIMSYGFYPSPFASFQLVGNQLHQSPQVSNNLPVYESVPPLNYVNFSSLSTPFLQYQPLQQPTSSYPPASMSVPYVNLSQPAPSSMFQYDARSQVPVAAPTSLSNQPTPTNSLFGLSYVNPVHHRTESNHSVINLLPQSVINSTPLVHRPVAYHAQTVPASSYNGVAKTFSGANQSNLSAPFSGYPFLSRPSLFAPNAQMSIPPSLNSHHFGLPVVLPVRQQPLSSSVLPSSSASLSTPSVGMGGNNTLHQPNQNFMALNAHNFASGTIPAQVVQQQKPSAMNGGLLRNAAHPLQHLNTTISPIVARVVTSINPAPMINILSNHQSNDTLKNHKTKKVSSLKNGFTSDLTNHTKTNGKSMKNSIKKSRSNGVAKPKPNDLKRRPSLKVSRNSPNSSNDSLKVSFPENIQSDSYSSADHLVVPFNGHSFHSPSVLKPNSVSPQPPIESIAMQPKSKQRKPIVHGWSWEGDSFDKPIFVNVSA